MSEAKLKTTKWYLFWRIYCVTFFLMLAGCMTGLIYMSEGQNETGFSVLPSYMPFILIIYLFFVSVFLLLFDLTIFTFNFSVFGPYERTPFPEEEAKQEWTVNSLKIGLFQSNGIPVKWYLYESGIGIFIWPKSKVFIPKENIVELYESKTIFSHSYILKHSSPELRSPVIIKNNEIFNALQDMKLR